MILMKLKLDNYMAFNDFQMSMTYAKKIVGNQMTECLCLHRCHLHFLPKPQNDKRRGKVLLPLLDNSLQIDTKMALFNYSSICSLTVRISTHALH